eukprot:scaffold456_cov368-Pavlova_lutheri.AAC.6
MFFQHPNGPRIRGQHASSLCRVRGDLDPCHVAMARLYMEDVEGDHQDVFPPPIVRARDGDQQTLFHGATLHPEQGNTSGKVPIFARSGQSEWVHKLIRVRPWM